MPAPLGNRRPDKHGFTGCQSTCTTQPWKPAGRGGAPRCSLGRVSGRSRRVAGRGRGWGALRLSHAWNLGVGAVGGSRPKLQPPVPRVRRWGFRSLSCGAEDEDTRPVWRAGTWACEASGGQADTGSQEARGLDALSSQVEKEGQWSTLQP